MKLLKVLAIYRGNKQNTGKLLYNFKEDMFPKFKKVLNKLSKFCVSFSHK